MFERFTHDARGMVVNAQEQARGLHHEQVLAARLLLAVLAEGASISARVLHDHDVQPDRLVSDVAALGSSDHDALREIGIDLTAARQRGSRVRPRSARPASTASGRVVAAPGDTHRWAPALLRRGEASPRAVTTTGSGASTPPHRHRPRPARTARRRSGPGSPHLAAAGRRPGRHPRPGEGATSARGLTQHAFPTPIRRTPRCPSHGSFVLQTLPGASSDRRHHAALHLALSSFDFMPLRVLDRRLGDQRFSARPSLLRPS